MSFFMSVRGASKRAQTVADRICSKKFKREQAEAAAKPSEHGAWRNTLDQSILSGLMPPIVPKALVPKWDKTKAVVAWRVDWKKIVPRHVVQKIFKACTAAKIAAREIKLNQFLSCIPSMFNFMSYPLVPLRFSLRPTVYFPFEKSLRSKIVTPKCGFLKSRSYYHTASLPEMKSRRAVPMIQSTDERSFPFISRRLVGTATSTVRYANTMVVSGNGITIKLNTAGYSKENITVEVEGSWLVVEALSTSTEESGGYLQRHMMRRYELPPYSDIHNIRVELNEQTKELRVIVPSIKPKDTLK
uniref:SHSP domain-containing protein n=1 Tax=Lygus hesperus TaxID=30085 RepID=A0A146LNB7_LYGHE